jgi:GNAT superfamily N-acetyltransferase
LPFPAKLARKLQRVCNKSATKERRLVSVVAMLEIDHEPPVREIAQLFSEYAASLDFDLEFQDFESELAALPGAYGRPRGALLLARADGAAAGCVGLRPLTEDTGELKRLYVRDAYRGSGIGRALVEAVIAIARDAGYRWLRLDTVPAMAAAHVLYRSLGFVEIEPYTHNPVDGARFFELSL